MPARRRSRPAQHPSVTIAVIIFAAVLGSASRRARADDTGEAACSRAPLDNAGAEWSRRWSRPWRHTLTWARPRNRRLDRRQRDRHNGRHRASMAIDKSTRRENAHNPPSQRRAIWLTTEADIGFPIRRNLRSRRIVACRRSIGCDKYLRLACNARLVKNLTVASRMLVLKDFIELRSWPAATCPISTDLSSMRASGPGPHRFILASLSGLCGIASLVTNRAGGDETRSPVASSSRSTARSMQPPRRCS